MPPMPGAGELVGGTMTGQGIIAAVPMLSAESKARMPAALRALGDRLARPFGGLSAPARARLVSACTSFADMIEAGEDAPGDGINLRGWPRFLLSALFALELTVEVLPLSAEDEAWLVAEIQADLGEARALLEARAGVERPAPRPPPLLLSRLIRS